MPASMTGYGSSQGPLGGGTIQIELRSVNHRHLTVSLKLPADLSYWEPEIRDAIRRGFERGHVTAAVRWIEVPPLALQAVDVEKARAVAARLREIEAAVGLSGGVTLELLLRQPDVMVAAETRPEHPWADAEPVFRTAMTACRDTRVTEGRALAAELSGRLGRIRECATDVASRAPERVVRERDRLRAAVATLLDGRPVDETRMLQEIAFLAEKLDVTEELVRLEAHLVAAEEALATDRAVGKQLGFLAQEMGREINTIGSKSNDAAMQHTVVAMKGELERFREQLENLE